MSIKIYLSMHSWYIGMAGSSDVENAVIWGAVDSAHDLSEEMIRIFLEKDEERKVKSIYNNIM